MTLKHNLVESGSGSSLPLIISSHMHSMYSIVCKYSIVSKYSVHNDIKTQFGRIESLSMWHNSYVHPVFPSIMPIWRECIKEELKTLLPIPTKSMSIHYVHPSIMSIWHEGIKDGFRTHLFIRNNVFRFQRGCENLRIQRI